jgi:hypothetical protein
MLYLFTFFIPWIFHHRIQQQVDVREEITYITKTIEEKKVLSLLNGFYGLISPELHSKIPETLLETFMGDGYIQGIFFSGGNNITFVKSYIKTERRKFLQKYHGNYLTGLLEFWCENRRFPNLLGVANTAFLTTSKKVYVLFERDKPYKISIDFDCHKVDTIQKMEKSVPENFLAHPKKNRKDKYVETLDYRPITKDIFYYRLREDLETVLQTIQIKTRNHPIIHDFVSLSNEILFFDSSFFSKKTYLVRIDKNNPENRQSVLLLENFYIFHYALYKETKDTIEIYASMYEKIDIFSLSIQGKYRKIIIDKDTNQVYIQKNSILETYNLDFPIHTEKYIVLRNIQNGRINGFVICNELEIVKTIVFPEKYSICGEPRCIVLDNQEYLIFLSYNESSSSIVIYRIKDDWKMEIPLTTKLFIGFHSIFLEG